MNMPLSREQSIYRDLVLRMLFDQLRVADIGLALALQYMGFNGDWLKAISNAVPAELAEAQTVARKTFLFDKLNEMVKLESADLPFVPFNQNNRDYSGQQGELAKWESQDDDSGWN